MVSKTTSGCSQGIGVYLTFFFFSRISILGVDLMKVIEAANWLERGREGGRNGSGFEDLAGGFLAARAFINRSKL